MAGKMWESPALQGLALGLTAGKMAMLAGDFLTSVTDGLLRLTQDYWIFYQREHQ